MENLKDTTELMTSGNYKDRFKAEYWQTKIRYEKLKFFCTEIEAAEISNHPEREPQHDCPLWLLKEQQKQMGEYLHTLEQRALIEDVDIWEVFS